MALEYSRGVTRLLGAGLRALHMHGVFKTWARNAWCMRASFLRPYGNDNDAAVFDDDEVLVLEIMMMMMSFHSSYQ